jgi:hypothetical protein
MQRTINNYFATSSLSLYLKQLYSNCKSFKLALKDFLCCHSFYTLEEYFENDKNI